MVEVDEAELRAAVQDEITDLAPALDAIGREVIQALQGFTAGTTADRKRPAHPGGWGDRTGRLSGSMTHEVRRTAEGWELDMIAGAPHVRLVEATVNSRTGQAYWVLRGIEDSPILATAVEAAVRKYAPGWSVG